MLTHKALLGLERALCDGYFQSEDFEIRQSEPGANVTELRILYRYSPVYALDATFNNAKKEVITETETTGLTRMMGALGSTIRRSRQEDPITVTMRPGEICSSEELGASTHERFLEIVKLWLKHMRSELQTVPQWREQFAWRQDIERVLADLADDGAPGEMFSAEEEAELRNRLDKLEADMAAGLEVAIRDQEELKRKTAELHSTVEFLKAQIDKLDKPTMKKAMMARWFGWIRRDDNRKLLKDGVEIVKLVADTTKDLL